MGFNIEDRGDVVLAMHPSTGTQVFGVSGKDAVAQMAKFLTIHEREDDLRFKPLSAENTKGYLFNTAKNSYTQETGTPTELYKLWGPNKLTWGNDRPQLDEPEPTGEVADTIEDTFVEDEHPKDPPTSGATAPIARSENSVPLDGAVAYAEGILAGDNPFEEGTDEADLWDTQWDQAADEAPEDEGQQGGSVVKGRYRQLYKELGHPNHSGDWLAVLLNNYCVGDKHTDLETFESICGLNGVDLSKYNRTTPGWQGRIRMTGRNLLAKVIYKNKHIVVPNDTSDESGAISRIVEAPADWLSAQRFAKGKEE